MALALLSCSHLAPAPTPTPVPSPTPSPTPEALPTATPEPPDTGWQTVQPDVEVRQVPVPSGDVAERLLIVRLDPRRFHFRVLYTPGVGRVVSEWNNGFNTAPLMVLNGGYFTPEYETAGLLVSDGQVYGSPYSEYAGMLAILPGGRTEVRWLAAQPYDASEMLLGAVQSFPVLIKPGGVMGFPADADEGLPARRTVVAQDRRGRILFVVAPRGYLSLHELAVWLAGSDLMLETALNLDGGQSTGLFLTADQARFEIDSQVPVPSVIAVMPR